MLWNATTDQVSYKNNLIIFFEVMAAVGVKKI